MALNWDAAESTIDSQCQLLAVIVDSAIWSTRLKDPKIRAEEKKSALEIKQYGIDTIC